MGYFSSSSTSSTTTAPLSAEGREWDSLFQGVIMQQLADSGYDLNPKEVTEYEDPARAKKLQNQVKDFQTQIDQLNRDLQKRPPAQYGYDPRQQQLDQLTNRLNRAQTDFDDLKQVTYTDYQVTKKEDPRVQQAIDKYGENSPQAAKIRQQIKDDEVAKVTAMANIETDYLQQVQKLVKGDLSYTPAQKQSVDQFINPVRDVLLRSLNEVQAEIDRGDASARQSLNNLSDEINKTGISVMDALEAAQVQIEKSGATLMDTLKKVNESAEAKAQFKFDLLSKQADEKAAQQAAFLGLPPGSMTERLQAQKMKETALTSIQLELADAEQLRTLGIQEAVEQGKQNISLSRVMLQENQGAKKEAVAQMGLGITQQTADKKLGVVSQKASALTTLEQQRQAELKDLVTGGILTRAQAAQSALGFNQNMQAANVGLTSQLLAPIQQARNIEEQRTFQESTTRNTSTPSGFDIGTGFLGTAASVAAPFMTGGASLGVESVGGFSGKNAQKLFNDF
jgi:hypothetical protein